jgi:hypothetical protein
MTERASTPSSICQSDPQGRDEAVAQEGAQNSVKKGVRRRVFCNRKPGLRLDTARWVEDAELLDPSI